LSSCFWPPPLPRLQDKGSKYALALQSMMAELRSRLVISMNDLRDFDSEMAARVMTAPMDVVPHLETALKEVRACASEWG
jgi:DNA replicative helicase MCM subunit Mcm2 (Cdc46/Mcm family)